MCTDTWRIMNYYHYRLCSWCWLIFRLFFYYFFSPHKDEITSKLLTVLDKEIEYFLLSIQRRNEDPYKNLTYLNYSAISIIIDFVPCTLFPVSREIFSVFTIFTVHTICTIYTPSIPFFPSIPSLPRQLNPGKPSLPFNPSLPLIPSLPLYPSLPSLPWSPFWQTLHCWVLWPSVLFCRLNFYK